MTPRRYFHSTPAPTKSWSHAAPPRPLVSPSQLALAGRTVNGARRDGSVGRCSRCRVARRVGTGIGPGLQPTHQPGHVRHGLDGRAHLCKGVCEAPQAIEVGIAPQAKRPVNFASHSTNGQDSRRRGSGLKLACKWRQELPMRQALRATSATPPGAARRPHAGLRRSAGAKR